MIAIVDYGVGNLFSLERSLNYIGAENIITDDYKKLESADKIILPGVGAFADAVNKLRATGLDKTVIAEAEKGKPLMGICLGMQMLFDKSYEYGCHNGLGLLSGTAKRIFSEGEYDLKIPQMGWNSLEIVRPSPLTKYIKSGDYVYFVHSYAVKNCKKSLSAITHYGVEVTAIVAENNICGTQFHPEKSGETGLNILRAFMELK